MILIAGGAGYIGSHTNKFLNGKGYETIVFDNLIYGHREFAKWGEFILGDLKDKDHIDLCFRKYKIDAVMHFSAFTYVGESVTNPSKYYQNNVVNTINLLDAMVEHNVKYFVFSSTCATYGIPQIIPMAEDHPQVPINPYGQSKLMIEQILRDYHSAYGIEFVNLRYFNAAGADPDLEIGERHDPETHLIPLVLEAAMGMRSDVKILGTDYETADGTCIRDYIHVMDIASVHESALEYLMAGGSSDSFNLGNGNGFSVREVIDSAARISGKHIEVVEVGRREGDPPVLIGNAAKAKKILHWVPKYDDLGVIIETAWRWHSR